MRPLRGTFVSTKIRPSAVPAFAVRRPRLERRLDDGARQRLTLVVAPAGFGKSVLLGQWASAQPVGRVAWLTIDERDRDPGRLAAHLVAALDATRSGLGARALASLSGAATRLGDEFVDLALDDLDALDDDLIVVLDDFDRLDGPSADDLGRLVLEVSPSVHLVIAGRSDPSVAIHRLRSRGELAELRAGDLRFTAEETKQVAEAVSGHRLTDDESAHLVGVTEGWPVAVDLAALSLRDAVDGGAARGFGGNERTIVDYLSAEVLEQQPPDLRSFLLDISVLEEVNADLCDAMRGSADGAQLLNELDRRALFVNPVPGEVGWYRLHRLMREFLRHDLTTSDPARPARLLGRAAEWWLAQGDASSAASCYIAARLWDPLLDLVYRYGRGAWDKGAARTVLSWIEAIPEPRRRADVPLRLTRAALELVVGAGPAAARAVADLEREVALTRGEQLVADMVMCSLVTVASPQADTLERAQRALAATSEVSDAEIPDVLVTYDVATVRLVVSTMVARTRLLLGDGAAFEGVARSVQLPEDIPVVGQVNEVGLVALLEALAGRLEPAVLAATRAESLGAGTLADDHPGLLFGRAAMVVVARLRDDLDEAAARAEDVLAMALRWRRWPWATFVLAERAMIELARGRPDAALTQLRRRAQLGMPPAGPMVEGRLRSVELRAGGALDDVSDVFSVVEPGAIGASWELAAAAVNAALATGRVDQARKYLDVWPSAAAPFGDIERELATALVEHAEGTSAAAHARIVVLLARTERDGLLGPYLDGGEPVVALLESVASGHPRGHLHVILERSRKSRDPRPALLGPLSRRELDVLRYLPTRMSNADIARTLYVSTNTIKSHVKHIYQKLAVTDRDDAVRVARGLGLL